MVGFQINECADEVGRHTGPGGWRGEGGFLLTLKAWLRPTQQPGGQLSILGYTTRHPPFWSYICLFLGPKLWEKPIQAKFNEDDFFVMNIDEFLAENNLQVKN